MIKNQGAFIMKKTVVLLLLLCIFAMIFSSCSVYPELPMPEDTNLEYWLLYNPYNKNWTELPNGYWMEDFYGKSYLAQGYEPVIDEDGNLSVPEHCVIYSTGNYPLIDMGVKRITSISITDPQVSVFGLTINSTREEIDEVMTKNGFAVSYMLPLDTAISYQNEEYRICFYSNHTYYNSSIKISMKNRISSTEIIIRNLYEIQKFFEGKN